MVTSPLPLRFAAKSCQLLELFLGNLVYFSAYAVVAITSTSSRSRLATTATTLAEYGRCMYHDYIASRQQMDRAHESSMDAMMDEALFVLGNNAPDPKCSTMHALWHAFVMQSMNTDAAARMRATADMLDDTCWLSRLPLRDIVQIRCSFSRALAQNVDGKFDDGIIEVGTYHRAEQACQS